MKVTITDREALAALSWEALRTYMDASDWRHADDISGKAAIYQHTDDTGRLWEILVPLRRDLGDYVSRMGDAVTILARIEDRSELDVYEDLRRLGAQSSDVDDATRAVHERIRRWLTEEGWQIDNVPVPPGSFNIVALQHDGRAINIFQHQEHVDHITMSLRWSRDHIQKTIGDFPDQEFEDAVWGIYRDITAMGVEFLGVDTPSTAMTLRAYVYFDGLTKDTLMHRIHLVNRAYTLAMRTFVRALQAPGHSVIRTLSPEDVRRIMRPVPQTDVPLTIAG